jgi:hypothetical protein
MNNNTQYNADFNKRIVFYQQDYKWVDSPMYGVERMMLDRLSYVMLPIVLLQHTPILVAKSILY